ncbi:IS5 family transposase [Thalassobius sp. I31.1]|uniref:IS5 family transposase n=1 Tax=Thalassobius sp. I31.1 TaxID=2109912 RepID=UPI000D19E40E|nr:IS5 family transposase [Thalassobius sp. I31.1]
MNEQRFVVSDILWQRLEPHLPGKVSDAGATAKDNRLFLEAVFWRVRTGSPWRDLPPAFGHWNSQFRRFRRWAKAGVFESLFNAMSGDVDLEYALIDGTIVQVHQNLREVRAAKVGANADSQFVLDGHRTRRRRV